MVLILFIVEIVGGVLAFVYYPDAKKAAEDTIPLYDNGTPAGDSVKVSWDAVHEAVSLLRHAAILLCAS